MGKVECGVESVVQLHVGELVSWGMLLNAEHGADVGEIEVSLEVDTRVSRLERHIRSSQATIYCPPLGRARLIDVVPVPVSAHSTLTSVAAPIDSSLYGSAGPIGRAVLRPHAADGVVGRVQAMLLEHRVAFRHLRSH
jgi:hypothetical protein